MFARAASKSSQNHQLENVIKVTGNTLQMPDGSSYRCAVGKAGIGKKIKEGDNITPIGTWALREVLYRADKMEPPETKLSTDRIHQRDIWIDDPNDVMYNKKAREPYEASYENLWRDDHTYDIVVPLGYNDKSIISGKGSAIFMHIAKEGYTPTAGCVALSIEDLREVLKHCDTQTVIEIS